MAFGADLAEGMRVRLTQKFLWGEPGDEGHVIGKSDSNGNRQIDIVHPERKPPLFGVPPSILDVV